MNFSQAGENFLAKISALNHTVAVRCRQKISGKGAVMTCLDPTMSRQQQVQWISERNRHLSRQQIEFLLGLQGKQDNVCPPETPLPATLTEKITL